MAVTADDLYCFANNLIENNEDEISSRSGASRAYYAAYHRCADFSDSEGLPEPLHAANAKGAHDTLIKKFTTYEPNKSDTKSLAIRSIGVMLNASREIRVRADYLVETDWDPNDAKETLRFYDRISDKMNALKG